MQQYTSTFCSLPGHTWYSYTRTNHNRCSSHKAFFCSLLRRWFWEKKPVHKDRKTMCLKAWQRKLQEEKKRLSYLLRGTKNRQKTFSICWLDECCHLVVKFSSLQLLPSCVGEKQAFSATNGGRWITPTEVSSNNDVCWQPHVNLTQEQLNSRKGNWKVVKIHTTQFPEKPW